MYSTERKIKKTILNAHQDTAFKAKAMSNHISSTFERKANRLYQQK